MTSDISEFRRQIGSAWNDAVYEGHVQVIRKRGARGAAVLLSTERLLAVLGDVRFYPEQSQSNGEFSVWLPELGTYGVGSSVEAALANLTDSVIDYTELYLSDTSFSRASNRVSQLRHVLRAALAHVQGNLAEVLRQNLKALEARQLQSA